MKTLYEVKPQCDGNRIFFSSHGVNYSSFVKAGELYTKRAVKRYNIPNKYLDAVTVNTGQGYSML